jgi:hypothetical protein
MPGMGHGEQRMTPAMMELHRRMMSDPVIQRRMRTDSTLRRLANEAHADMSGIQ